MFKMDDSIVLDRLQKRASEAEEMIRVLRTQLCELKKAAAVKTFAEETLRLRAENQKLESEVDDLLARLVHLEKQNGVPQIALPGSSLVNNNKGENVCNGGELRSEKLNLSHNTPPPPAAPSKQTEEKPKKSKPNPSSHDGKKQEEREADVSRLNLRIGLILTAKKHPDADSLYVEDVDVGEGRNRTVVSGLVRHVPIEDMQNRLAVFLCNLKPAKMRGVLSEAMVMCASTPEKVEILIPPPGSIPGDRVTCEGFEGEPDKELNPKKKIFEKVAPDLKTDNNRVASYKGVPWSVPSKGLIVAPTLANVQIK